MDGHSDPYSKPPESPSQEKKTNEKVLEDLGKELEDREKDFSNKRDQYKFSMNIWISMAVGGISVLIFIIAFFSLLGLSYPPEGIQTFYKQLASKDFINNQFASILSLSLSLAMVLPIAYTIARNLQTQKRNTELSSLSLQIRHLRSKITIEKQKQILEHKEEKEKKNQQQIEKQKNIEDQRVVNKIKQQLIEKLQSLLEWLKDFEEQYLGEKAIDYEEIEIERTEKFRRTIQDTLKRSSDYDFVEKMYSALSDDKNISSKLENIYPAFRELVIGLELTGKFKRSVFNSITNDIEEVLRSLKEDEETDIDDKEKKNKK